MADFKDYARWTIGKAVFYGKLPTYGDFTRRLYEGISERKAVYIPKFSLGSKKPTRSHAPAWERIWRTLRRSRRKCKARRWLALQQRGSVAELRSHAGAWERGVWPVLNHSQIFAIRCFARNRWRRWITGNLPPRPSPLAGQNEGISYVLGFFFHASAAVGQAATQSAATFRSASSRWRSSGTATRTSKPRPTNVSPIASPAAAAI